ncbi:hypothetical protein ES708_12185 [subsurface metagenome]
MGSFTGAFLDVVLGPFFTAIKDHGALGAANRY